MRWFDSTTDSMDMNLSKLWEIVKVSQMWYILLLLLLSRSSRV